MKSSNAITGYVVGIMPSQNGDAKVNNSDMVTVPAGTTVTITAHPANDNYVIDLGCKRTRKRDFGTKRTLV